MQALKAIIIKEAVEKARTRSRWSQSQTRPHGYEKTFFAQTDLWQYIPSWDAKQCDTCGEYALGVPFFSGDQIRGSFPNWEYSGDEDILYPVIHPNCRCELHRVIEGEEIEVLTDEESKEAFTNPEEVILI